MCNSIRSTIVTWLIMLSLFLSGCAAVAPGMASPVSAVVPHVTELNPVQAESMIKSASDATANMLRLYNASLNSWAFVQYVDDGYNVVMVLPAGERDLVSKLRWSDVNNLFQTLKTQGWDRVSLASPWVAAAISQLSRINFIFMFFGQFEHVPGMQEVGLG